MKYLMPTLFAISFLMFVTGCKKPRPKQYLLAKTHEGRNTLAYVISDGNVVGGLLGTDDSIVLNEYGNLSVYQNFEHFGENNLQIHFAYDSVTNIFHFDSAGYQGYFNDIYYNSPGNGYLSIDYQTDEIIAGIFEFQIIKVDTTWMNDTTFSVKSTLIEELTRGRFDIKY